MAPRSLADIVHARSFLSLNISVVGSVNYAGRTKSTAFKKRMLLKKGFEPSMLCLPTPSTHFTQNSSVVKYFVSLSPLLTTDKIYGNFRPLPTCQNQQFLA